MDDAGKVTACTDGDGFATRSSYDGLGRINPHRLSRRQRVETRYGPATRQATRRAVKALLRRELKATAR